MHASCAISHQSSTFQKARSRCLRSICTRCGFAPLPDVCTHQKFAMEWNLPDLCFHLRLRLDVCWSLDPAKKFCTKGTAARCLSKGVLQHVCAIRYVCLCRCCPDHVQGGATVCYNIFVSSSCVIPPKNADGLHPPPQLNHPASALRVFPEQLSTQLVLQICPYQITLSSCFLQIRVSTISE